MKRLLFPVGWLFLAVAAVSVAIGRPEGVFLGLGCFVIHAIADVVRSGRRQREGNPLDQVSNDDRARLAPVYRSKVEIDELVAKRADSGVVRAMGPDAQADAQRILDQSIRLLNIRAELRRARNSQSEADGVLEKIRRSLEEAVNPEEKDMLQSALDARMEQQKQIERAEEAMESIDANLVQASAALSELKTRLLLAGADASEFELDEMRSSIAQLEALSNTFDEAEQVMKGTA